MPNIAKFAKVLHNLHLHGFLKDADCKEPVILFIRQATEPQTKRHWHLSTHYRSKEASKHLEGCEIRSKAQYQSICRKELSHEYIVPNIVIYQMIMEEEKITEKYIEALFAKFSIRATITRDENKKLARHTMPKGFYTPGDSLYQNPFARYIKTGPFDSLERRSNDSWFN